MKAVQKTLLASLLAMTAGQSLVSTPALAADSIDVRVIGTIVPAACKPALTGGAVIDYGLIPASDILADDYTVLETKNLDFSIACEAPAKVALTVTDARAGTAAIPVGKSLLQWPVPSNAALMGLGQADGKNIGAYAMQIAAGSVKLDGGSTSPDDINTDDRGATWTKGSQTYGTWLSTTQRLYSWAKTGELTPVAFTTLTGTLNVQASINKGSELDLTKAINLDGQSSIELVYL